MKKFFVAIIFCFMIMLSSCSKKEEYQEYKFELNEDGMSYTFSGFDSNVTNDVVIPNIHNNMPVTKIGEYAFYYNSVESVFISENIKTFFSNIFAGCDDLKKIEVDKDNKKFDSRNDCNAIILSDTNTLIAGCNTTKIPNDIEKIGLGAFQFINITEIDIPDSVHTIEDYAFYHSNLDYLVIPDNVLTIGNNAFAECRNLAMVRFTNNLQSIGEKCFYDTAISEIYIPKTVNKIGGGAFGFCSKLNKIEVDEENEVYDSRDNCNAIIETKANKIIAGCRNSSIFDFIDTIGTYAFSIAQITETFIIPSNIKIIEPHGFICGGSANPVVKFENNIGWYYFNSNNEKVEFNVSEEELYKNLWYQDFTLYCEN